METKKRKAQKAYSGMLFRFNWQSVRELGRVFRDAKTYRSIDVPWRIQCFRIVDQVYSVFIFGSESWLWSQQALNRIEEWVMDLRDVCCLCHEDRKIGEGSYVESTFQKVIGDRMRRAVGWVCVRSAC